jgi:ATP-dependent exoDNAse (exonuclease V) alpha subunit
MMDKPLLEFVTGQAGTGKSYTLRKRMEDYKERGRKYATQTATTGIAAINLSGNSGETVTTINSELGYFDTNSLQDNFASRRLHNALKRISKKSRNLSIDEISMMDKLQLQLICDALKEVNELKEVFNRGGLGLIISGDFCQLPPVKGEFCFHADCWKEFEITKLTKVWRQSDVKFLEMLNAARCGDGKKAADMVGEIQGIQLTDIIDSHFDGTTILPLNKYVDSFNKVRLDELIRQGKKVFTFKSFRWGRQYSEWKSIPEERVVCKDAYVMILANDAPQFSYANGSCGYVTDAIIDQGHVYVKLISGNQQVVKVRKVTRKYTQKEVPEGCEPVADWLSRKEWEEKQKGQENIIENIIDAAEVNAIGPITTEDNGTYEYPEEISDILYKSYLASLTEQSIIKAGPCKPYFDYIEEKWVIGAITYTPIRLAYASTVHKSQGLSLDKVQIDYSNAFFGEPSMSYVALSRCRTPEGLTIVGSKRLIEERTNITSEILEWL